MGYTPGDKFAGYTIERLIGRGGMGEVYLAAHPSLPRREAVKILPADLTRDPMFRQRFIREAELASAIVHPNIVTVYNSGEHDGHLWIAMEYIDGVDAGELLRGSPYGIDPALVSTIATAVASALDAAHAHGLLHRDVKPANILVQGSGAPDAAGRPARVLLADFGIAKATGDVTNLTSANMFLGTVAYVAPEQLLGTDVDGRADQYSLAATLFQLLCGHPPFEGSSQANVVAAHLNTPAPMLSTLRPGTPNSVDEVLDRALGKSADGRFRSCGELAADLDRAFRGGANASAGVTDILPVNPTAMAGPRSPATIGPGSAPMQAYPPYGGVPPNMPVNVAPSAPGFAGSYPGSPITPPPGGASPPGYSGGYPIPARRGTSPATIVLSVVGVIAALALVIGAGIWVAGAISGDGSKSSTAAGGAASDASTTAAQTQPTTTPYTRPPVTEAPTQISSASQISVGNCLQIGRQPDSDGSVSTTKVDCATAAMTFYAAEFISSSAQCPNDQNATLTFGAGEQKLCLTPNFAPGECYQIPRQGGSLAAYHEVACGSSTSEGTVPFRVTNRGDVTVNCQSGETRWTFNAPQSLGYCLTAQG